MRITIRIDESNAAWKAWKGSELMRVLNRVAKMVSDGNSASKFLDINGNTFAWIDIDFKEEA